MEELSSSEEELFVLASLLEEEEDEDRRERRRYWVHPINRRRSNLGEFHHLFPDLEKDPAKFFQYFRMSRGKFQELLNIVKDDITLQNTTFRRCISAEERLAVCLRFLATGDTFKTIAFSYRLGETTVREIVHSTCNAIWRLLRPKVMPSPTTEMWTKIEEDFYDKWNFPNCCGALDGKHVVTDKPDNSGSLYFNYKHTFSIVLMALVDANYKFVTIDVGSYGKNSDAEIFSDSQLGRKLSSGDLNLPPDKPLPQTRDPMPHLFVADEAFPLQKNLMRPYPRKQLSNNDKNRVLNYRLSRARRVVENAFGILAKRFRLYRRAMQVTPEHLDVIVCATCCLHNFLQSDSCHWLPDDDTNEEPQGLQGLAGVGGNPTDVAIHIREKFCEYFNSPVGSVHWQLEMVRSGVPTN